MASNNHYRRIDISGFEPVEHDQKPRPDLIWVAIDDLVFDNRFQRDIERRGQLNIAAIAGAFDWGRFTPLLVSGVGPNRFSVIDGQHRAHAAALCGYQEVPAMVVPMLLADQAKAFAWVNGNVTNVSAFHIYRAALTASEPWAVQANQAVTDAGCELMQSNSSATNKKAGQLYCVVSIRRFVEAGKAGLVTKSLLALTQSNQSQGVHMYSSAVLLPWFDMVESAGDAGLDQLITFLDANPFDRILAKVDALQKTPAYFRKSTRVLFGSALLALFNQFKREQGL